MKMGVKPVISSETQQFREYIDRLTRTLKELSSNPNNFKNEKEATVTREQIQNLKTNIANILIENVELMSLDQVATFREMVISDKVGIELRDLDVKVAVSTNIKNEVLQQYDKAANLLNRMALCQQYLKFGDGSFSILILSRLLVDYENDSALNRNPQCINFLEQSIVDIAKISGPWELNAVRDEIIDKISKRDSIMHHVAAATIAEINATSDNSEKVLIFNKKMNWKNVYVFDVLEPLFKSCGSKDTDNILVCEFIGLALTKLSDDESLSAKDKERCEIWCNRFRKIDTIERLLPSKCSQ